MKILLAALCACAAVALPVAAADGLPDAAAQQQIRDQLRTDRKVVIEHNMSLTDAEAKKFWPVYEAFQRELAPIQTRSNRAMLDYINAGDSTMTNTNARRLLDQLTQAEESEAKVKRAYVAKFSKAVGAKKAARYYQVESKIRAMERYDQATAITLVR
jgi:Spy/CpxP family protein refolding chaperone